MAPPMLPSDSSESLRAQLDRATQEFIAAGGQIEQVTPGPAVKLKWGYRLALLPGRPEKKTKRRKAK